MIRFVFAGMLAVSFAFAGPSARADVKIVSAKSSAGKAAARHHGRHHGGYKPRVVAVAVPRCGIVRRSSNGIHWQGLACPRLAWAGSAPRQPWSYEVFRHRSHWEQRSALWQSRITPGPTHPTIYWGY